MSPDYGTRRALRQTLKSSQIKLEKPTTMVRHSHSLIGDHWAVPSKFMQIRGITLLKEYKFLKEDSGSIDPICEKTFHLWLASTGQKPESRKPFWSKICHGFIRKKIKYWGDNRWSNDSVKWSALCRSSLPPTPILRWNIELWYYKFTVKNAAIL